MEAFQNFNEGLSNAKYIQDLMVLFNSTASNVPAGSEQVNVIIYQTGLRAILRLSVYSLGIFQRPGASGLVPHQDLKNIRFWFPAEDRPISNGPTKDLGIIVRTIRKPSDHPQDLSTTLHFATIGPTSDHPWNQWTNLSPDQQWTNHHWSNFGPPLHWTTLNLGPTQDQLQFQTVSRLPTIVDQP